MSAGNISSSGFIKRGQPKISGGAQQFGVPGLTFTAQTTVTPTVGEVRYHLMFVENPILLSSVVFEVTAAPASDANVRIGIYTADVDQQPLGGPVYDSGNIPVATGFTGIKTTAISSLSLPKGVYLIATNIDVAMTLRTATSTSFWVGTGLGASALTNAFAVTEAFGAFKTPGTKWPARAGGTAGQSIRTFFTWSE